MASKKQRIGVLTSGGDAPGLNAVIRAVVKSASGLGWEVIGIHDGFEGLLGTKSYRVLTNADVQGLLPRGGTILRTTNKGHFCPRRSDELSEADPYVRAVKAIEEMGLRALITIGGEGTQRIALELHKLGAPVIGVPKTIDNDLAGTDRTFGFDTALQVATDAIDRLHTTAASHNRVMILEVMGRHTGWIALHAGLSGGADVILIPEIPFSIERVAEKVMARDHQGSSFSIIVVAEGARPRGGSEMYIAEGRLGGIGHWVGEQLEKLTAKEVRVVVLGHLQRGGSPSPYDRLLSTRYGAAAVQAAARGIYGEMVALRGQDIVTVPLAEACGYLNRVRPHSDLVLCARSLGIAFGDEL
ncbi:ATP-dependent 6-phosphofructokinase [Chloroflexus sp.]|uniref:6-phosphofructokinase n=1 Tax=Chloroflexus sp. TaxID=1904827 RepID=UPI002ADE3053|nr:ATP-dependent 6-phosphofructokinase [Chloroflexus sp.]